MKTDKSEKKAYDWEFFKRYRSLKILVIGDLMLDHYIQSTVDRTSPEAPVAVALMKNEEFLPGGAANVACNLSAMGAKVILAGLTGKDEYADILKKMLKERGIQTGNIIADPPRPTTLKTRIISRGQQIIRIDREENANISLQAHNRLIASLEKIGDELDGVIVSDYSKGTCSDDLLKDIMNILKQKNIPVICDPKKNDFSKYRGTDILTPNLKEASEAAGIKISDETSLEKAAEKILSSCGARSVVITRGGEGVSLFRRRKKPFHIPAHAQEVYDVTGAGDTFISHFGLALFSGLSPEESVKIGNYASSIAVSKIGVAVVTPDELASFIRSESFSSKFKSPAELKPIVVSLKSAGKKVVFTNGCFDLIHVGHIKFLQAARNLGDCLIVGINTDSSVQKLKGPDRPLISETERADLLAALHWVDYVVLFDETTPEPLLRSLKPDILVKGKNLKQDEIVGSSLVKNYGGKVQRLPFFTSSKTTERLRKLFENLK